MDLIYGTNSSGYNEFNSKISKYYGITKRG